VVFLFFTKVPNIPFVHLHGLAITHPENTSFHIEMDCTIGALLSVYTMDFLSWLWEQIILENVGSWVPRHAPFPTPWDLKPRAKGFFAIEAVGGIWRCRVGR
jgi:hypothetical protein